MTLTTHKDFPVRYRGSKRVGGRSAQDATGPRWALGLSSKLRLLLPAITTFTVTAHFQDARTSGVNFSTLCFLTTSSKLHQRVSSHDQSVVTHNTTASIHRDELVMKSTSKKAVVAKNTKKRRADADESESDADDADIQVKIQQPYHTLRVVTSPLTRTIKGRFGQRAGARWHQLENQRDFFIREDPQDCSKSCPAAQGHRSCGSSTERTGCARHQGTCRGSCVRCGTTQKGQKARLRYLGNGRRHGEISSKSLFPRRVISSLFLQDYHR